MSASQDQAIPQPTAPDHNHFYTKLPGRRSFRLLRLQPLTEATAELHCTLEVVSIEDHPNYTALSYTWGPPYLNEGEEERSNSALQFDCRITCDEKPFYITSNLWQALVLASTALEEEYIWVDAMCINQVDVGDEKSAQILLMASIYEEASQVLVWLGPEIEQFEDFSWVMSDFTEALNQNVENDGGFQILSKHNIRDRELHRLLGLDGIEVVKKLYGAMTYYEMCRWFHRAWIAQECIKAKNIRMFCGTSEIEWYSIFWVATALSITSWGLDLHSNRYDELKTTYTIMGTNIQNFETLRQSLAASKPSSPFDLLAELDWNQIVERIYSANSRSQKPFAKSYHLLRMLAGAHCTDPRDQLYSAFGLISEFFDEQPLEEFFIPDYSMSTVETYVKFTRLLLRQTGSLYCLSGAGLESSSSQMGLPTWVVNLQKSIFHTPIEDCANGGLLKFNVWGDISTMSLAWEQNLDSLLLKGAVFDTVTIVKLSPVTDPSTSEATTFLEALELCTTVGQYPNGQNRLEVLWRTIICNCSADNVYPAPDSFIGEFAITLKTIFITEFANVHGAENLHNSLCQKIKDSLEPFEPEVEMHFLPSYLEIMQAIVDIGTAEHSWDVSQNQVFHNLTNACSNFRDAAREHSQGRVVFKTEKGLLGMGPVQTSPGDQIWLLGGALVPFLLRPVKSKSTHVSTTTPTFNLVGDCYLHGFMHGEMLDKRWRIHEGLVKVAIV